MTWDYKINFYEFTLFLKYDIQCCSGGSNMIRSTTNSVSCVGSQAESGERNNMNQQGASIRE